MTVDDLAGDTAPEGWRALLVDPTPLRVNPEFRRLFTARMITGTGSMITYVALPAQVYELTGSTLRVGLVGLAEVVPLVGAALFGGALADRLDRRRLIVGFEFAMVVCTIALALNAARGSDAALWPLYVFAAISALFDGLQRPAIEAFNQQVVAPDQILAANGLNSSVGSFVMIVAPVVGGVVLDVWGFEWAFAIDALTFAIGGSLALTLSSRWARRDADDLASSPLADIRTGLRYAWSRKELFGSYVVDINAMVFGMPLALFPAMASDLGGATTLGLLYAGPAIGALLASALGAGIPRRVHRHGQGLLWAATVWGLAISAFGFSRSVPLAVTLLAVAGAADMVSGLFRGAIWNQTIPNELRGRLAGIEMVSYSASPPLGNLESGVVAAATNVRTSVVSGGALCVIGGAVIAATLPALRKYDAREAVNPHLRAAGA